MVCPYCALGTHTVVATLLLHHYTLLGSEPLYVVLAYTPAHILNTLYLGPCIAICHTLVAPNMRASASAVLLFVINMIGLGLGPLVVGALSDAYIPIFGEENLRYAMLTALTMGTSGVFFFWMAHRTLLEDISKTEAALTGMTAES